MTRPQPTPVNKTGEPPLSGEERRSTLGPDRAGRASTLRDRTPRYGLGFPIEMGLYRE